MYARVHTSVVCGYEWRMRVDGVYIQSLAMGGCGYINELDNPLKDMFM